jgi:L-lactate dehydrogenase (cytochrome)
MIQHSAPAPIDVLYEMRHTKPELFDKLEVYVDSGVRRGTDVVSTRKSPGKACHDPLTSTPLPTRQSQVKALALGATAVGLGRPFLYGNGTYGEEGCAKVYEREYDGNAKSLKVGPSSLNRQVLPTVIYNEVVTAMALVGARNVSELKPEMVRPKGWMPEAARK